MYSTTQNCILQAVNHGKKENTQIPVASRLGAC